jgi:hypothetical protein
VCHISNVIGYKLSKPLELLLPNGQKSTVNILKKQKQSSLVADYDRIKHYGHVVLQLGLIYNELIHFALYTVSVIGVVRYIYSRSICDFLNTKEIAKCFNNVAFKK